MKMSLPNSDSLGLGTINVPRGSNVVPPNLWELFYMGQGLKMGRSRALYKDLISIMQMNDLVWGLEVGKA